MASVLESFVREALTLTRSDRAAAVTQVRDGSVECVRAIGFDGLEPERVQELVLQNDDRDEELEISLRLPLEGLEGILGRVILVRDDRAHPYQSEDEELVRALAAVASLAVQNARLFAAETERASRGFLLQSIASEIRGSLDLEEVLSATVRELGSAADVDHCFIRLTGGPAGQLGPIVYEWRIAKAERSRIALDARLPLSTLAARTRTTVWSNDVASDERLTDPDLRGSAEDLLALGARSALATPLAWGGDLLGVVAFHSGRIRRWTDNDIALIEGAAREVSVALHHAKLYDEAMSSAAHLQQLDEIRADFVAMLSHELRSPMTVIANIADILENRRDELNPERLDGMVKTLGREAKRLARLVTGVLDLEAIDRGGVSLVLGDHEVAHLAREAAADAGESSRTTITCDEGDTTVRMDRDKIKQVFLNLISNAAKYSSEDLPIRIHLRPQEEEIFVSVSDRGPGIPEEDHDKLFRRFSRLGSTKRKTGSGLGLYLSKLIVERHGGSIWLARGSSEGSTFVFRIPRMGEVNSGREP